MMNWDELMLKKPPEKASEKELAVWYEENYGGMTNHERNTVVLQSIRAKNELRLEKAEADKAQFDSLSYGDILKAVANAKDKLSELEGDPKVKDTITDRLIAKKREKLEAEYAHAVKFDLPRASTKELWISEKLLEYMKTEEYRSAKKQLKGAREELATYLALKEAREKSLTDVIAAEQYRTRRADLFSADPEALRALGIEPPTAVVSASEGVDSSASTGNYMDGTVNEDALLSSFMEARGYGKGE